jgi:hypothetical protein
MVFREQPRDVRSGTVHYGPFPIRRGRLFGSFAPLVIGAVIPLIALEESRVQCTPNGSCVITTGIIATTREMPMSQIREVRVKTVHGNKGGVHGVVLLSVDRQPDLELMQQDPAEAGVTAGTIRAAIAEKKPIDLTLHGPRALLLVTLGAFAMWLTMAYSALKGLGRLRLDIEQGGVALRVRRRVLGIPVSSHVVSLEGVTDVRVEGGVLGEMWLSRGETPSAAARIVLIDRSGVPRPITDRVFPGEAVHLRAAAALRALLGFERLPGGVEDRLAQLPPITTAIGMRVMYSWIGATTGLLVGIAIYGVMGLALGLLRGSGGLDAMAFLVGGLGGSTAGVALALYLTRQRPMR